MTVDQEPKVDPKVDPKIDLEHERICAELRGLGLERHTAELDDVGFTIIPPELANPGDLPERLLAACLDVAERRQGVRPDTETGATHAEIGGLGTPLHQPLGEAPEFEEAMMNPVVLAMATYLNGYSCVLNNYIVHLKGPGGLPLPIHCDAQLAAPVRAPLVPYSIVANCTYALTDYTLENGALAIVPGSHKWARPSASTNLVPCADPYPDGTIPVECPAGSLIVWHGNTWHGSYPRTTPGLRVGVIVYFCRWWIRPQHLFHGFASKEGLERYGPRLSWLMSDGVRSMNPSQLAPEAMEYNATLRRGMPAPSLWS
jgi:hypothetical protein